MKNKPINILDAIIQPGQSSHLAFPMPEISSYAPIFMPIKIIHGKQTGPILLVLAGMHGDELNGTEIINRLLKNIALKRLKGTLIMIPVFNVYGHITRSRYLTDGLELDKAFPGKEKGSVASRFAHTFTTELLSKADYCIDLRTGAINHINFPQIYADPKVKDNDRLANAFKAPIICHIKHEKNTLGNIASEKNIPYLVYEAGEANRFNEREIKIGIKGILNILNSLDMVSLSKSKSKDPLVMEGYNWIRSPKSGISYSNMKLGQKVENGQYIATVKDPFGASDDVSVSSYFEGIIVAKNNLPLVHEGETLFQVAAFKEKDAASELNEWKSSYL